MSAFQGMCPVRVEDAIAIRFESGGEEERVSFTCFRPMPCDVHTCHTPTCPRRAVWISMWQVIFGHKLVRNCRECCDRINHLMRLRGH